MMKFTYKFITKDDNVSLTRKQVLKIIGDNKLKRMEDYASTYFPEVARIKVADGTLICKLKVSKREYTG